jgi:Zn-finger domain-containing protein
MLSGLFWKDDECEEVDLYYFTNRTEYIRWVAWSIRCSIKYLRKHVWRVRIPGTKRLRYGYMSKKFVNFKNEWNRDSEKTLRHSVEYWQGTGLRKMKIDIFEDSDYGKKLPTVIIDQIIDYL